MGIFEFEGGYPILNLFFVLYAAFTLAGIHLGLRSGVFSGLSEVPKSLLAIFISSGVFAGIVSVSFGLLAWVVRKVDNVPGDWSAHGFTVTIVGAFVTTLAVSIAMLLLTGLFRLVALAVRALFQYLFVKQ